MGLRELRNSKVRALLIVLVPLLLSGLISTYLIYWVTQTQLHNQSERFSQTIANHLASSVVDHVMNNDRLGLNVLLSDLLEDKNFDFASVSNTNNQLLAQVGKKSLTSRIFSQQVTFHETIAGSVQISFNQNIIQSQITNLLILSAAIHGLAALALTLLIWFYSDMIYLWIMQPLQPDGAIKSKHKRLTKVKAEQLDVTSSIILVIKVRPVRLLAMHRHRIEQALALYTGELLSTQSNDIEISFHKSDQLFQATCTGLLTLALFRQIETPITIKIGMHMVNDRSNAPDFQQAGKHASYLASISENEFLTSRIVGETMAKTNQYVLQPFHSSMTPDGEVYRIAGLVNQNLIEGQAKQLGIPKDEASPAGSRQEAGQ
jgi:hypothetical protein